MRNIKVERTGGYNHALENESNDGLTVVFMGNNEFRAKNSSTIFLKKNTTLKSYNGDTEENTLRVWCYEYEGIHVQNKATLTIEGLGIEVYSDKHYPLSAKREEGLYIKNSAVTVYGGERFYDFKDITFENITFDARSASSILIYIADTDPSHYYTLTLKGENKGHLDTAYFIRTNTNFTIKGDGSFTDIAHSQGIRARNRNGMTLRIEGGCALNFMGYLSTLEGITGNETLEIDNASVRLGLRHDESFEVPKVSGFRSIITNGCRLIGPAGVSVEGGDVMLNGERCKKNIAFVKSELEKPSIDKASVKVEDVTHTTATVTWKQATDNATPKEFMRYLVFLDDSRTGNRELVDELMGKDTLKLTGLKIETRYKVTVKAQDECGNFAFYNDKIFTTPTDKEAYAAVSGSTLTFYYDNQRAKRSGHLITNSTSSDPAWPSRNIRKVVFDASFKNYSPTSTYHWFAGMSALERVEGTENLNSREVLNMVGMFEGCTSLKELDLMKLVVSSLSDISEMFKNAENLTTIYSEQDWRPHKTDNMFKGCEKLVGVVAYDANKTSSLQNTEGMFKGCECLGYIYCNEAWTATRSTDMFYDCGELIGAVRFDPTKTDIKMANPTTGYFTRKGSTGINRPTTVDEPTVKAIYGTDGRRRNHMEPGINILKMSDGTTRKVVK